MVERFRYGGVERANGTYVKHSDYEALEAQCRELSAENDATRQDIERYIQINTDLLAENEALEARCRELEAEATHAENALVAAEAHAQKLREVGAPLATIAYNLAQGVDLPEYVKRALTKAQQDWDAVLSSTPTAVVELRPRYEGDQNGLAYAAVIRARKEMGE